MGHSKQAEGQTQSGFNFKRTVGYILGFLVIGVLIYVGGVRAIKSILKPAPGYLVLYFAFMALVLVVGALRWRYILSLMSDNRVYSYFDSFVFHISGRFFGQYVSSPVGDIIVRPAVLKRIRGVNLRLGVSCSVLDKLFDVLFVIILMVPCLLYLTGIISSGLLFFLVGGLLGGAVVIFYFRSLFFLRAFKRFLLFFLAGICKSRRLAELIPDRYIESIEKLETLEVFRKDALMVLFFMTAVKYVLLVLRIEFLTLALGLEIPVLILFVGVPVAQLTLAAALTPGALGVLEGGWYAVLISAGIPKEDVATFLIGQRAWWFIFTSAIFLTIYLLAGIRKLRH